MKSKADEEEYWHSSKFKAFTFDDEDDEFSRVRPEDWGRVQVPRPGPSFRSRSLVQVVTVVSSGTRR